MKILMISTDFPYMAPSSKHGTGNRKQETITLGDILAKDWIRVKGLFDFKAKQFTEIKEVKDFSLKTPKPDSSIK